MPLTNKQTQRHKDKWGKRRNNEQTYNYTQSTNRHMKKQNPDANM